jgi:DNA (cytosine-5)-methyltransferase 1
MRILNLYAGLGGNRRLWTGHEITAVEIRKDIAAVYTDYYSDDTMIIGDAHKFLLENYFRFDFIWSSPPCQTHSRAALWAHKNDMKVQKHYPDMCLYQEIIFLKNYFKGLFVIENVIPFYDTLIKPSVMLGRHLIWSNFRIHNIDVQDADIHEMSMKKLQKFHSIDLDGYRLNSRKDQLLRNCVSSETGLHILDCATGKYKSKSNQLIIF